MRKSAIKFMAIAAFVAAPFSVQAELISLVEGGQTTVLFNASTSDLVDVVDILDGTIAPGSLGPSSVAFPILSREDGTTFQYTADTFAPFAGTIEHGGGIVSGLGLSLGSFTIGYDESRVGDDRTGFFVQDNLDTGGAVLFDLANPIIEALDETLVIAADILVSQELSDTLLEFEFIDGPIVGADAGMALVVADASVVPIPAAAWLFASALGLLGWVRRRV